MKNSIWRFINVLSEILFSDEIPHFRARPITLNINFPHCDGEGREQAVYSFPDIQKSSFLF